VVTYHGTTAAHKGDHVRSQVGARHPRLLVTWHWCVRPVRRTCEWKKRSTYLINAPKEWSWGVGRKVKVAWKKPAQQSASHHIISFGWFIFSSFESLTATSTSTCSLPFLGFMVVSYLKCHANRFCCRLPHPTSSLVDVVFYHGLMMQLFARLSTPSQCEGTSLGDRELQCWGASLISHVLCSYWGARPCQQSHPPSIPSTHVTVGLGHALPCMWVAAHPLLCTL